jgi:muramidase (phage lysozyme)
MPFLTADQCGGQNAAAFLDMIAVSEIGTPLLAVSDNGYNVLVGSTASKPLLFTSYANHPNIFNKQCNSDAAGRYQIMHHWWEDYMPILHLPDFSPASQDLYAVEMMRERHALPLILAGNLAGAISACCKTWASLPGSPYGQHVNAYAALQTAYLQAGGSLA